MMSEIQVQRATWRQWADLAPTWERIHAMCPDASFFLSREWVDCWLAEFGNDLHPDILIFNRDGDATGCCLLVRRTERVRGIPLRRVYLNCAGENEADSTYIEYNSILCAPNCEEQVAAALARFLKDLPWDELLLQGTVEQEAVKILADSAGSLGQIEVSEMPARRVSFSALRKEGLDYLSYLSSKTRHHIRRTRRAFEEAGGPCAVKVAETVDEALEMLQTLAGLHQARWEARDKPGCFDSVKFTSFHQRLIREHFANTMLFRVNAGPETVGLLYCLRHRGWVYHYQSGFNYSFDKRWNPGILTLYSAIDYCMLRGDIDGFDFMAGDSEYKRSLAGDSEVSSLRWLLVRNRTVRTQAYVLLRTMKRKYVEFRQKARHSSEVTPAES